MTPFERGFLKAAAQAGFSTEEAFQLAKRANVTSPMAGGLIGAGVGGLGGSVVGGVSGLEHYGIPLGLLGSGIGAGYGAYKESDKPKAERNYVKATLGGAAKGGALGLGGAGLYGAGVGGIFGSLLGGTAGIAAGSGMSPEQITQLMHDASPRTK